MIRRRAAPGPPPPGTRLRAAARAPRQARRPGKAPPCGPETPHVRPRRPRPGKRPAPRKSGPRWPGNAAVAAAREHSAVCAARAPGRPPPPEAQLAPARAARRAPEVCAAAPAPPGRPRPSGWPRPRPPVRLAPRRPPRWPDPRGCTPRGAPIPGRDRLETAAPSHAEKATIKRGINPARKGW